MKKILLLTLFIFLLFAPTTFAGEQKTAPFALMYHKISDNDTPTAFTISSKTFEDDIKYLKDKGYTFCTATEFNSEIKKGNKSKLVAITFDDGYASDFEKALPILEKYNAKATFFIIGELIGKEGYMNEHQLKALARSEYAQIGSHTYKLHNMKQQHLKLVYKKDMAELALSDYLRNKKLLEKLIGMQVTSASYPYGIYNKYFDSLLKQEGIITFSSDEQPAASTLLPYGRFNRASDTSIEKILSSVNPIVKTPSKTEQYLVPTLPKGYLDINT